MVVKSRNGSYWIQVLPTYFHIFCISGWELDVCHSWQTLSEQLSRIPDTKFLITMEKHVQKQERNAFQTFLNCLWIDKDFRQLRLLPLFKNPESFYSFTRSIPFFLLNSWCMWFVYLGQVGLSENFRGNQRAKCVLMLNFTSTFVLPNN